MDKEAEDIGKRAKLLVEEAASNPALDIGLLSVVRGTEQNADNQDIDTFPMVLELAKLIYDVYKKQAESDIIVNGQNETYE
jgi:hypothetical protein